MTVDEAKERLKKYGYTYVSDNYAEYDDRFVFNISSSEIAIDSLRSVFKNTGLIKVFDPLMEYSEKIKQSIHFEHSELNELYHHGVKGQKWGIRRTPEELGHRLSSKIKKVKADRELERKQRKAEKIKKALARRMEAERKRQEAAKKRREAILDDPIKLSKHKKEFTKEEIDQAIKKFEWEKKLDDLSNSKLESGKRKVDAVLGMMTSTLASYDQVARVVNTVLTTSYGDDSFKLPYIDKVPSGDKKKK